MDQILQSQILPGAGEGRLNSYSGSSAVEASSHLNKVCENAMELRTPKDQSSFWSNAWEGVLRLIGWKPMDLHTAVAYVLVNIGMVLFNPFGIWFGNVATLILILYILSSKSRLVRISFLICYEYLMFDIKYGMVCVIGTALVSTLCALTKDDSWG